MPTMRRDQSPCAEISLPEKEKKYITASEFDEKFDTGEDISEYLDIDNANRPDRYTYRELLYFLYICI